MTLEHLLDCDRAGLAMLLREGYAIPSEALSDTAWLGVSLGMPGWVDRLAWKTFSKTFHADPEIAGLRGWNVRLHQDGITAPPRPIQKDGVPVTFGHYRVRPLRDGEGGSRVRAGLMLDYGAGGNGWWDPVGLLRDPLVSLSPQTHDLLLGWSFVSLAGLALPTPSYFALKRIGGLDYIASPSGRQAGLSG